ncbi:PE family protein [Mycobacterium sp. M1]|uniref:PE family protein n=1 Tax=Mycolicibacter acidiphilus TaxID=2835306 RepID=A0ABS5RMZ6_9MYCO|nr:PE family protein [Mycolicibacter acidiphilus]MBS9535680.1 PE family protein [Mycolicibacter acidiphilus]
MAFVTTHPEALTAAATNLQGLDSALTAQNAAAAAPITGVLPAAADEVSALQALQFAAYGKLYEQIAAQAAAMQEMFVHTLRTSADSYGETEAANSAAAGSASAGSLAGAGTAVGGAAAADPTFGLGGIASNSAILAAMQGGTIGSAASEFTGLGKGYITNPSGVVHHVDTVDDIGLASQVTPVAPAVAAAAPAAATVGQTAPATGAPATPAWASGTAPEAAPETPEAITRTTAATAHPDVAARGSTAAVPAGMPGSSSDQGSRGRIRYGVKPKVMPERPGV